MNGNTFALALFVLFGAVSGDVASAQCAPAWPSATPLAELSGNAQCSTLWDPDGSGPEPFRLVVGGESLLGGAATGEQSVLVWDGTRWESLADGPSAGFGGSVTAMLTWNGQLVVGGWFGGIGGALYRWDGSSWQGLMSLDLAALAVWNGNIVQARTTGDIWVSNGTQGSFLPHPPLVTQLDAVVAYQGMLCVAGLDAAGNGVLERWNGTSWLPSIQSNGRIRCLAVRTFSLLSTLYVGGDFTTIGGTPALRIASTTGGTTFAWNAVGNGLPAGCRGLHVRSTSALGTAVVARVASSITPNMQLVGNAFVPMGTNALSSIAYYAGAYHGTVAGAPAACLRWDGLSWLPVAGPGIDGEVRALAASGTDMIVGGTIQAAGGVSVNRIARWDGATFQPLGTGLGGSSVEALLALANGDVVAGGLFTTAGGNPAGNVARWNGSTWSPLGAGCDQQVSALARLPNGDIVAGGSFATAGGVPCARIARWNGTTWAPLGSGANGDVLALAVDDNGTLYAGGAFTTLGGQSCSRIARWNGTTWAPLGTGCSAEVYGLTVRQNGDVVAVGAFATAGGLPVGRCARWTGTAWAAMGASSADPTAPRAVVALPGGDVVAGRGFHQPSTSPDAGVSRWNGSVWSNLGSGLAGPTPGGHVSVRALALRADGAVVVGGSFGAAGGLVANGLATLTSSCRAVVTPFGAGCNAAGPLTTTAETWPWLGADFRTATTGITPSSFCLHVVGFSTISIPLGLILPQGQPGCTLLVANDILLLAVPDTSGTARSTLALPPNMALIGRRFFQQAVHFELAVGGVLVAVQSSNGLDATIGMML